MPPKHNQESGFPLKSKYDLGSFGGGFGFPLTTALGTGEASFAKKQRACLYPLSVLIRVFQLSCCAEKENKNYLWLCKNLLLGKCSFLASMKICPWLKQMKIKVICFSNPKVLRKQWNIHAVDIVKFVQNPKIALEKPRTLYTCAETHTSKSLLMKD